MLPETLAILEFKALIDFLDGTGTSFKTQHLKNDHHEGIVDHLIRQISRSQESIYAPYSSLSLYLSVGN